MIDVYLNLAETWDQSISAVVHGSTSVKRLVQLGWAAHCAWTLKLQATSPKLQAASLTAGPGYDRMDLERINYD